MKTNVADTSIDAYRSLQLNPSQAAVHETIQGLGVACNQLVADSMGLPVNQVTGRVFELRDKGLVEESHKAQWPATRRTVTWWKVQDGQG